MRLFVQLFTNALIAYGLGGLFPYWVVMILIGGLAVAWRGPAVNAFIAGSLGVGLVWLLVPLISWSATDSELPEIIARIMGMENGALLVGITALLGFLIGGSSALTGNLLWKLFQRNQFY
ncbi:hypothetical protein [Cyclobacterium jeungdonense]|uniref:Uncharacterized protein n=1 Tax=Cyclobacterium jeungdonense TaxID=708087 RepID=A0ABT8C6E5_9BACT|nr:hypothetical protein [Cyclobacterium jeungdonense]MDN3687363.1 hypothetical protein [Cyclobacterium jeungdonense]